MAASADEDTLKALAGAMSLLRAFRTYGHLAAHLERLRGVYSDALIALVGRCLSLEPALRPQSVLELQKALPNGLAGHNQP